MGSRYRWTRRAPSVERACAETQNVRPTRLGGSRLMRVLVSCYPMRGHLNTVLPLAIAAQRAGHEVVVATGADMVTHVQARGLTAWAVGPSYTEAGGVPTSPEFFRRVAGKPALDLVP